MSLSHDIISEFVKVTNNNKEKPKEGIVYATIVQGSDGKYVKIDGSDLLTPADTTTDIEDGERVTVMIKDHKATVTGNVTAPSASGNRVDKVVETVTEQIGVFETVVADKVSTNELEAYKATIEYLVAGKATIEDLEATNAVIENLKVKDAEIENLVADKATIEDLEATNAVIENLKVKDAEIENAVVENLEATKADIQILNADFAQIKTLVSGNLTSDNILSFNITADKVTMEDAFIKDAMIANVNAAKINAGRINTNSVVIGSEDGGMSISGATQQFTDKNGNVRIQIGRDASDDFTFALYGEDGQGQLINQNGITASAISDGIIVNDMISDDASISGGKLDISSVVTEINNDNTTTIKSNKIYLDEQNQSLEVAFKSLKTQVDTIKDIDSDLTTITDKIQSNTSKIEANKSSISTLLAEDAAIKKQVTDLEGNVVETTNTLTSKYTSLQQNLDGFKTTVNNTYATKTSVNDVKNNLSSNYSTTSAMNSAIQQKVDAISASVSSTYATKNEVKTVDDNIKANYSTTEQMESAISVAKNEINLGVSKVYETKTEVSNKIGDAIDKVLIGGRNLIIRNTETKNYYIGMDGSLSKADGYGVSDYIKVDSGESLAFSKKDSPTTDDYFRWAWYGNDKTYINRTPNNSNKFIWVVPSGAAYVRISYPLDCYPKVERGTKHTDWAPAPEDVDTSINNAITTSKNYTDSQIKISKDAIELGVSQTYETKTSVTSKVNSAISTASSDATSKANNALSSAKSYADTKKSEAIASANNTLNTTIANYYTKSQTDSQIKVAKDAINLGVSETYETKTNVTSKVNSAISTASSDASTKANNALNSAKSYADTKKSEAITSANNTLNSTIANYYTKAQTDSQIKIAKDAIDLSVKNTYETKTEVSNKINNIQVGGRNLMLKTDINKFGIGLWVNNGGTGVVEGTYVDGTKTIKVTGNSGIYYNRYIRLKRNTIYTYSMMIKPSAAINVGSSSPLHMWLSTSESSAHLETVISSSGTAPANIWTKVWITFKTPNTQDTYYMRPFLYEIGSRTVYMTQPQVEEGNKASSWMSALEDTQTSIDTAKSEAITSANNTLNTTIANYYTKTQTDSQIKIAKDAINLGVSETYETKTNVTSKVNSAISTASSDATSKANNALNSAKSYADTKKSEAITSANNTLNSTIANYYTKAQTDSQINIAKDAIDLSVKNTYETKTEVANKINAIQVGGRNLVSQSRLLTTGNKGAWSIADTGNEGFKKLQIVTTDTGWLECQIPVTVEINSLTKKVTVSFEYYESNAGSLAFSFGAFNGLTRLKEITNVVVSTDFKVLATSPWKHVSYTFDPTFVNDVANATRYQIQFKKQAGKTGTIYVRKPKLEIGTVATDWSPAPEDVTSDITQAKNDAITSANGTLTSTIANYYTKAQTDSQIKIAKDAIDLSVKNTYETKANVQSQIDSIQVGSRNLVQNSTFNSTDGWAIGSGWSVNKTEKFRDNNSIYINRSGLTADGWTELRSNPVNVKQGEKIVGSWYIKYRDCDMSSIVCLWGYKADGSNRVDLTSALSLNGTNTNWTRYVLKGTVPANVDHVRLAISHRRNGIIYAAMPQLEYGNTATDWSPSPVDVSNDISQAKSDAIASANNTLNTTIANYYTKSQTDSQISIAKDAINLGVSQTYETKTNVTSKVNSAISTASSDASTKANNALTSAKSYADTKKSEAITSANNTLNSTIANYYTKAQTDSQINVAKNAITSSVSSTYETKTNVQNKIDAIKVGGRNLWLRTKEYKANTDSIWVDNSTGSRVTNAPYTTVNGFGVQRIAAAWTDISQRVAIESNTEYTLSAFIKWESQVGVLMFYDSVSPQSNTNVTSQVGTSSYKRVSVTFNSNTGTVSTCRFECTTSTPYLIYGLKLEKGNKATDWSPAPEDMETTVANLTQRVSTAEQKITDTAITNVVKQNFYTKTETNNQITSKGYQTSSQVKQTVDALELKFTQSGGYNLIRNGKAAVDLKCWTSNGGGIQRTTDSVYKTCIKTSLPSGIKYNGGDSGSAIRLKNSTHYVYEAVIYSRTALPGTNVSPLHFWCGTSPSTSGTGQCSIVDYRQAVPTVNKWTKCYVHILTASSGEVWFTPFIYTGGSYTGDIWVTEISLSESSVETPYSPHASEIYDGVTTIDKDGVTVKSSSGAYTNFNNLGMNSFNNSGQQTLGIKNGGITFHPYNTNQLGAYITQSALWSGSVSANGLAISTANNGTYISLGTSSLSDANTSLSMDQALTISASDNFQPKGINFWKNVHAHGYGIRQLAHLQLAGSSPIQFDYLNTSPSTIYEATSSGHSLYVMGGYQMHLGCMDGKGSPKGVIWMENSTNTHSYTHWNFHNYTMYNMKTATSYANTLTNRYIETYGINSNVDGIRYLYRNIELVDGVGIRNLPNGYKGCPYDIVSIVCKGRGHAWVECEDEYRFIINGDCKSVNVEIIIYPTDGVMTMSSLAPDESPTLEAIPERNIGEQPVIVTNEGFISIESEQE